MVKLQDIYFIPALNLFEGKMSASIASHLESFTDKSRLANWLVDGYVRECAEMCSEDVKCLFDDINTDIKLRSALSAVVEWRQRNTLIEKFRQVEAMTDEVYLKFQNYVQLQSISKYNVNHQFFILRMKRLIATEERFCPAYVSSMLCLCLLSACDFCNMSQISIDICDELYVSLISDESMTTHDVDEVVMLHKATRLLQLIRNGASHTMDSILFILSHAYLQYARRLTQGKNHSLHCLATVYLAALYHFTGLGPKVITRCKQVVNSIRTNNSHQCISHHVVEGRCLPQISSDIDNVCGLIILYCYLKYLKEDSLTQQQQQQQMLHADVFTISLFVRYLQFMSPRTSSDCRLRPPREHLKNYKFSFHKTSRFFINDLMLLYIAINKATREDKTQTEAFMLQFTTSELQRALVAYSVEQLAAYRQNLLDHFKSLCIIATTDVRAMHAYQCEMYEQCLQLSEQATDAARLEMKLPLALAIPTYGTMTHLLPSNAVLLTACVLLSSNPKKTLLKVWPLIMSVSLTIMSLSKLGNTTAALRKGLKEAAFLYKQYTQYNVIDRLLLAFTYRKVVINLKRACDVSAVEERAASTVDGATG